MKVLIVFTLLLVFFFSCFTVLGQDSLLNVNNHSDCKNMMEIKVRKTIGPTTSPEGAGDILEFNNNSRTDLYFMEKENNSVWYKFKIKTKGNLSFVIEPLDSLNDYDFALYKYTENNFCEGVKNKKIKPLRSNFSRNKIEIMGKTGLSASAENEFVAAGVNPAYSKSVKVVESEEYVLLVNNVYENGEGHILHFDYSVNLSLKGNVVDIDGEKAVEANITLTNTKTGDVLVETTSDSVTGDYSLKFDISKSQMNDPLHLEIFKDDYFFHDTIITAFKIATKMRNVKLYSRIKKLKKGDRFVVSNILFHGNSPKPLDRSLHSIKALYKTMKRNKGLKISIEGHTNGCGNGASFSQQLSDARALTIFNFLTEREVNKTRLSSVGYGCKHMLHSERGSLAHLNRRVEIEIVDF